MSHSLFPEHPILISPAMAKALGLDATVMLSVLNERTRHELGQNNNGYAWFILSHTEMHELFPFWDTRDIQRVITQLREQGVLLVASAPFEQSETFKFSFNEKRLDQSKNSLVRQAARQNVHSQVNYIPQSSSNLTSHSAISSRQNNTPPPPRFENVVVSEPAPGQHAFLSKNFIAQNWQPDQNTLDQIAQHAIPTEFCYQQVPEFITYWHERGEAHRSWGSKFLQHVIRQWRSFEEKNYKKEQETAISNGWIPSHDAMEILLKQAEIPQEFIEDAIPEFILYWQERGDRLSTWNTKFIQHVRLQWKKYHSSIEHSTDPKPIAQNWQPSNDVYDVLRMANIDLSFAQSLLPEFILFWKDSNQLHTSWNTRFLQHTKRQWAQRHNLPAQQHHAHPQTANNKQRLTREISLEEQLNDRSWAN